MALDPISAALDIGGKLIDRLWPNPEQAAQAKLELVKLQQSGELQVMTTAAGLDQGQQEINKVEAASTSLFVSGWRPAIGWVCAVSLAAYFIPRVLVATYFWGALAWDTHSLPPMPEMGIGDIIGLTGTLLGSSTIRMFEKKWGVASK